MSGKKGKKTKGKSLSLGEFLGATNSQSGSAVVVAPKVSSWADETDEFEADDRYGGPSERIILPTAPRQARGPSIDMDTVPTTAPFIAYVANLPFDVEDEDIERFFKDIPVGTIRLPKESGDFGRFKGFGYVEFSTRADLIEALSMNEDMMKNRKIRVDVAEEESSNRRPGLSRNDEREDRSGGVSDWRAAPRDSESSQPSRDRDDRSSRNGPDRSPGRDFSNMRDDRGFGDRGYNDRFSDRSFGDRDRDRGFGDRDRDRGFGDRDRDRGYGRDRGRDYGYDRGYDRRGDDRDYDRGGRFGGSGGGGGGGRFDDRRGGGSYRRDDYPERRDDGDRWRRRGAGDGGGGGGGGGGSGGSSRDDERTEERGGDPPKERPRLQLKPRSKQAEEGAEPSASANSSIFGAAKPVDTASREKEIEKKLTHPKDKDPAAPPPPKKEFREVTGKTDIFGSAKPVDTYAREKEIEEKLKKQSTSEPKRVDSEAQDEKKSSTSKPDKDSHPPSKLDKTEKPRQNKRADENSQHSPSQQSERPSQKDQPQDDEKDTSVASNPPDKSATESEKKASRPEEKITRKGKKSKDEPVIIDTTNKFQQLGLEEEDK